MLITSVYGILQQLRTLGRFTASDTASEIEPMVGTVRKQCLEKCAALAKFGKQALSPDQQ